MAEPKFYPELDPRELEPHFSQHMLAMTAEGLHDKSAIAEQLAWRDQTIASYCQSAELERLRSLAHSITGLITIDAEDGPSLHDPGYRSIVAAALTRWFDEYEKPRLALLRANEVAHRTDRIVVEKLARIYDKRRA